MNVQTYLFFNGDCEEALRLYEAALGLKVTFLQRYSEGRPRVTPNGWEAKIFHATAQFGDTLINMSDRVPSEAEVSSGFALLAHMDSEADAERAFEILLEAGHVKLELQPTPWASSYGIVRDKFGVTWKIQA